MKKLSIFLLTMFLGLVALVGCDKKEPEKSNPTETPTETQTETPTETPTETETETEDPNDTVLENTEKTYHVVGGFQSDWAANETNAMTAISMNQLAEIDANLAAALADKPVKYLYAMEGYALAPTAGWPAKLNGEDVDGGYTVKVIRATYDSEDENYVNDQWLPDPSKAHVESLTPDTLFMPKWVEKPADGEEALGKWDDNPVVSSGAGHYTIVLAEYTTVSSADAAGFGLAVVKEDSIGLDVVLESTNGKTYHTVGGNIGDWAVTETNGMTAVSLQDLIDLGLKDTVKDLILNQDLSKVTAYVKTDYTLINSQSWTSNAGVDKDGEQIVLSGGYTVKVIRAVYDEEDENYINDQWITDPKTAHAESLTPNTLFIPQWREEDTEGDGLGKWDENPVCISGAGKYTVVVLDYGRPSSADVAGFGLGLVLTEELEEIKTMGEKIQEEYDALVKYDADKAAWDALTEEEKANTPEPTPVVANEFTLTGEVVDMTATRYSDKYSSWNVRLILDVDGVLVGVYDGQVLDGEENPIFPTDINGLEVGTMLTVTGTIAHKYSLDSGDYHADIEFSRPVISWPTLYTVTVRGIPADATAANVHYWNAGGLSTEWPGKAGVKNDDGSYTFEVDLTADSLIINWTVGEATSQTVNLAAGEALPFYVIGEADEEGKFTASQQKCFYDAVTVDHAALVAALSEAAIADEKEVPAEYDLYVWFWGGSATGWFEVVNADGTFNVAEGTTGGTFIMVEKDAEPSWAAKIAQTGDYVIAAGVATPKPAAE